MDPNTSGKKPDAWIADKIYITLYLLAFGMTVTAILTGITNQVQFQCSYVNVDEILSPAAGYPHLPNSCKISLGMGLVVLASAIFTVFTVVNRLPLASPNYSARGSLREHLDNDSAMSDKVSVDGVSIDGIVGPHKSASVSTKLGSWVPFEVVPFLSKFTWWSAILAVILGVFAIATVSAWATDKPVDYQYIGKATWSKNNLTLHIVMMVVGFFVAQLYAVAGWSLIQDRTTAKVSHIVLQSIAALFMIIGMAAVVKHKKDAGAFDLNTMHSWLGVCAVTIFGINYIFGVGMAYYTRVMVGRESEKIDLRPYHRPIGIIALVLTGIAILTGINEQTGTLTCTEGGVESLANGCKLAFSMGLFVLTSGICAIFAVFYRVMSLSSGQTAVASQTGGIVQSSIAGNVDVSKDTGINDVDSPMMDGLNA
jgi:cytochrome b-561